MRIDLYLWRAVEGADEWRVLGEMLGFRGLEGRWASLGVAIRSGDDRPRIGRVAGSARRAGGWARSVRQAVRVGLVVQARLAVQAHRFAVQDRLAVHAGLSAEGRLAERF